ncbi:unnamed protein product, partial [Ectocarpus sp. 8 AP-2014]
MFPVCVSFFGRVPPPAGAASVRDRHFPEDIRGGKECGAVQSRCCCCSVGVHGRRPPVSSCQRPMIEGGKSERGPGCSVGAPFHVVHLTSLSTRVTQPFFCTVAYRDKK